MKNLSNIEKSAFKKDQYVGYANGRVYHINRNSSNPKLWNAHIYSGEVTDVYQNFYLCKTLSQLNEIFAKDA